MARRRRWAESDVHRRVGVDDDAFLVRQHESRTSDKAGSC